MYRVPSRCSLYKTLPCPKVGILTEAGRYCTPNATCDIDGDAIISRTCGSTVEVSMQKVQMASKDPRRVKIAVQSDVFNQTDPNKSPLKPLMPRHRHVRVRCHTG